MNLDSRKVAQLYEQAVIIISNRISSSQFTQTIGSLRKNCQGDTKRRFITFETIHCLEREKISITISSVRHASPAKKAYNMHISGHAVGFQYATPIRLAKRLGSRAKAIP
jgi:hypothetical protein